MQQIRPVTDLQKSMAEITKSVVEDHSPVILTKNGYGHMVLLSYEDYNRLMSKNELYRLLDEGMADIKAGRTIPFDKAIQELREEISSGRL